MLMLHCRVAFLLRFIRVYHPEEKRLWLVPDEWQTRRGRAVWLAAHSDVIQQCARSSTLLFNHMWACINAYLDMPSTLFREKVFVRPDLPWHVRTRLLAHLVEQLAASRSTFSTIPAVDLSGETPRAVLPLDEEPALILARSPADAATALPPAQMVRIGKRMLPAPQMQSDLEQLLRNCAVTVGERAAVVPLLVVPAQMADAIGERDAQMIEDMFGGEKSIAIPHGDHRVTAHLVATIIRFAGFMRLKAPPS